MEKVLTLTLRPDNLRTLSPIFQQGVIIKTVAGCSIRDFLSRHLGLTDDYLDSRIQTLFLNGKAVDNPEKAVVRDGATLALSGAMPGLVGATLRRGGTYASLRQAITLSENEGSVMKKEGRLTLKLFNLLVPEIGPILLAKGFWVKGEDLDRCVKNVKGDFWTTWSPVQVDGQEVDPLTLTKTIWAPNREEPVLIQISLSPSSASH